MKLWKTALFVLTAFACSCVVQPKPKLQITHVLAVTPQGDTLQLPIDVIRPINYKIINYSSGYGLNNWYRPYHNTYHNYNYSYNKSPRSSNNSSNINKKITPPSNNKSVEKPRVPASEGVNINRGRN
mgnify:CR=1 FL=1|tara:strand:- start:204 stop:584 length:381 start_codon:yes stop_codon:yes gene_type:complete